MITDPRTHGPMDPRTLLLLEAADHRSQLKNQKSFSGIIGLSLGIGSGRVSTLTLGDNDLRIMEWNVE